MPSVGKCWRRYTGKGSKPDLKGNRRSVPGWMKPTKNNTLACEAVPAPVGEAVGGEKGRPALWAHLTSARLCPRESSDLSAQPPSAPWPLGRRTDSLVAQEPRAGDFLVGHVKNCPLNSLWKVKPACAASVSPSMHTAESAPVSCAHGADSSSQHAGPWLSTGGASPCAPGWAWPAQGPGPLSLQAEHNKEHCYYRHFLFLLKVILHTKQMTCGLKIRWRIAKVHYILPKLKYGFLFLPHT